MFKSLTAAVHWPLGFLLTLTLTVAAGEAAEEASPSSAREPRPSGSRRPRYRLNRPAA